MKLEKTWKAEENTSFLIKKKTQNVWRILSKSVIFCVFAVCTNWADIASGGSRSVFSKRHFHMRDTITCASLSITCALLPITCASLSRLHHHHMCVTITCASLSHVRHYHMCVTITCASLSHVRHYHMCVTITCASLSRNLMWVNNGNQR
jgi:hypothetical protein